MGIKIKRKTDAVRSGRNNNVALIEFINNLYGIYFCMLKQQSKTMVPSLKCYIPVEVDVCQSMCYVWLCMVCVLYIPVVNRKGAGFIY